MSNGAKGVRTRCAARGGFTLIEVLIALLVLQIAVMAALGIVVVASSTLGRAERLERAVALVEGVIDSLIATGGTTGGSASYGAGDATWAVRASGEVTLVAVDPVGDTLFRVGSVLPPAPVP